MGEVPDFSSMAREYAAARPLYPPELFDWLASSVRDRDVAWDTATGSGQAALGLATHFARVIATACSPGQLQHAMEHPRIEYRVAAAEESGLAAASVDLAAAAAAIHWFDLDRFYTEVGRVVRRGGVLAVWNVKRVGPRALEQVLWPFYRDVVGPHFAPGARMVDAGYTGLALPGKDLAVPPFQASVRWSAGDVLRRKASLVLATRFAGGLSDAGLPAAHTPTVLLIFSAGVEAGHFFFVGVVLSAIVLIQRVRIPVPAWTELVPPYAIGAVAMSGASNARCRS